jgi:sRNA-binding protein
MIGIDAVLIKALKPAIAAKRISKGDIRGALKRYTRATGYLARCAKPGVARIGLSGECVGIVTADHARFVEGEIRRRRAAAK